MVGSPRSVTKTVRRAALERPASRLDTVVRELRKRAPSNPAPGLVGRAVDALEGELAAVRRQLGRPR
jgi:hypothetical protein